MNSRNLNKIITRFPSILVDCHGYDIENGWANLLFELLEKIEKIYPETKILQIKEKFGAMRVYPGAINNKKISEEVFQLTYKYEEKSQHICEFTGEPGTTRILSGWMKTCCDEIWEKAKKQKSWNGII